MGKALVITEKPSVARDIAGALGGFTDHDGYFESDDLVVTFAVGHLFELLEPDEIDEAYKRWTLASLPIIPDKFELKPKKGQSERIRTIQKLLARKDIDAVVNACDAGREGELIFREIIEYLGSDRPIQRLWLRSMTREAIREGFAQLRPGEEFEGLAAAAECRAWSDWLIGMNATRALTKRLKSRRERTAWSAGRVQTPTLAILVGRELELLAHEPRPYWRVVGTFEHEANRYTATWYAPDFRTGEDEEARDDRIFDEALARAIAEAVSGRSGTARESRKPSRESPPPLFDLTGLQREANRRFGWSARRTLSAAQRCYEGHKILTYPRTASRCLPSDYRATVEGLLEKFAAAAGGGPVPLGEYAAAARRLRKGRLHNVRRTFDDAAVSDHFAIIPTGVLPRSGLSGDDRRVYDLVVRRFLGNFHPPAVWERVERVTEVGGEHFRTRARSLQEPGWRAVLPQAGEEEAVSTLAPLRAGFDEVEGVPARAVEVEVPAEETRPPPRITEGRLLSLMENAGKQIEDENLAAVLHEKGIGTPATRAEIIENLIAKGYVVRIGKSLRPTVKGIRLIDLLQRIEIESLSSPGLTGEIEHHLNEVEHGRRAPEAFLAEIQDYARAIVERAKSFEYEDLYRHDQPLGTCPVCGRPVFERAWFYTCETAPYKRGKKGEETVDDGRCPLVLWKDISGRYLARRNAAALLRDGKTGVLEGFLARSGRLYNGMLELDRNDWKVKVRSMGNSDADTASDVPEYEVDPEPLGRCPFDEECVAVESPTHFICERKLKEQEQSRDPQRPRSCGFVLPRTVCKREVTREEARIYLKDRRTDLLTDFVSRFGRPFSARLVLRDSGRHGFEFQPRAAAAGGAKRAGGGRKTRRRRKKKAAVRKARGVRTGDGQAKTRRKKATGRKTAQEREAASGARAGRTSSLERSKTPES